MPEKPQAVPSKHIVPDFEQNWQKVKDLLPWTYWGWKKEDLDSLMITWQRIPEIDEKVDRLGKAVILPDIPSDEVAAGKRYLENTIKELDIITEGIIKIGNNVTGDITWSEVKPLFDTAEWLNGSSLAEDEQAIALLEEINLLQQKDKLPKNYKMLVAQWGLTELMRVMKYDIYDYTAAQEAGDEYETQTRSTQDSLPEEKDELKSALKQKKWTEAERKSAHSGYLGIRNIINGDWNEVPVETLPDLEKLWKAATKEDGEGKMSALEILQLTEDIYVALRDNEGLDIDLNEYVEDEDEEIEEEEG